MLDRVRELAMQHAKNKERELAAKAAKRKRNNEDENDDFFFHVMFVL